MADEHGLGAQPPRWLEEARLAQADAEKRTGVAANEWRVADAQAVTWGDSSLGLPEPGMGYAQALVPGFRLVLEHEGRVLRYHTGWGIAKFAGEGLGDPAQGLPLPPSGGGGAASLGVRRPRPEVGEGGAAGMGLL